MDWQDKRQLVKVSNLYYRDGLTQAQIAKKMGVSRPVISKLLQRAKDEGIVEIFIKDESLHTVNLELEIESRFDLCDVIVVPNKGNSDALTMKAVGLAGAEYLSKNMSDIHSIGVSWGTTVAQVIKEYPYEQRKGIQVIPLEGGMGVRAVEIHANHLANELSKKLNGFCSYLYAPAIVGTKELKTRLMEMQDIKEVLDAGREVDLALIGIGNPHKESTLMKIGYLKDEDIMKLKELGAVGDIGFRFFDEFGIQIEDSLNDKVIGISLGELKHIKKVIAVTVGEHKVKSVLGALRGGYIDVLITDEKTAEAITEKNN